LRALRLAAALAVLLLGGCLVSKEPLITAENAAWPLEAGSVVEEYKVESGRLVPSIDAKTGGPVRGALLVEGGSYVWHRPHGDPEKTRFLLHAIGKNGLYVVMFALDAHDAKEAGYAVLYGFAKAERGQLVLYQFDTKEFEDYAKHMQATDPERWKQTAAGAWRAVADGRDIEVGALAFLDEILPEMAAGGFHREDVRAYRIATGG
jgi:hypothetical protein